MLVSRLRNYGMVFCTGCGMLEVPGKTYHTGRAFRVEFHQTQPRNLYYILIAVIAQRVKTKRSQQTMGYIHPLYPLSRSYRTAGLVMKNVCFCIRYLRIGALSKLDFTCYNTNGSRYVHTHGVLLTVETAGVA